LFVTPGKTGGHKHLDTGVRRYDDPK